MNKTILVGLVCLSLATAGCGVGGDGAAGTARALSADEAGARVQVIHDGAVEVRLERIGSPKWKPADFHNIEAPWKKTFDVMQELLPPPSHVVHPALSIGPGAPHAGPYDGELAAGVAAAGYVDGAVFSEQQFKTGVLLTFLVVPSENGAPRGSSPDFASGPIIPNTVFPIHVAMQWDKDGAAAASGGFDVPALDGNISPPFNVDGHSHFPIYTNDAAAFYPAPATGSYRVHFTLTDTRGDGWDVQIPYTVQ